MVGGGCILHLTLAEERVGGVEAWIQGQYLLHGLFLNPSHVKYFNTPNFFIYFFL